jgi:hypothetical protein
MLLLASIQLLPAATDNQILLRSFDPTDGAPTLITSDSRGHLFVVCRWTSNSELTPKSRVVELDLNGARLASFDLAQIATPAAVATD